MSKKLKMKIISAITVVVLLCCLEVAYGYPSRYPTRGREYLPYYDDDRYVSAQEGRAILNIFVTIITELHFSHSQGNTSATRIEDAQVILPYLLQTCTGPVVVMVTLSRRWAAASIVKVCQHHGYLLYLNC